MSRNPYQYFTVEHISRASIACKLNQHLGRQEFKTDDERLTDLFCGAYAAKYGWISDDQTTLAEVNEQMMARLKTNIPGPQNP